MNEVEEPSKALQKAVLGVKLICSHPEISIKKLMCRCKPHYCVVLTQSFNIYNTILVTCICINVITATGTVVITTNFKIAMQRTRSKGESVYLRSVTPATAGFYRCEASGEAPSFPSVSGGGQLMVVILPKKEPNIYGGINEDTVELNCTTDASRPAAHIRWFINNVQVNHHTRCHFNTYFYEYYNFINNHR